MIVQIDSSGWSQERKNMTHSMVVLLLHEASITHTGISVNLPNINITSEDVNISTVITKQTIESAYDAWKIESDAETALAIQTYNTRNAEYNNNIFVTTSYDNIEAYIDSLSNLAELKGLLKKMAKAIKFKLIKS